MSDSYNPAKLTHEQARAIEIARIGAMSQAPFFAYFYRSVMSEYPTYDVPTAGTNGSVLYFNPDYLFKLEHGERIFVWVHEIMHAVYRHPQRMLYYQGQGEIRGMIYIPVLFNVCADLVINAKLVSSNVGQINASWLHDPSVTGDMLVEDVYKLYYKPPPHGGGQTGPTGQGVGQSYSGQPPKNNPNNSTPQQNQQDSVHGNSPRSPKNLPGIPETKQPLPVKGPSKGQTRGFDPYAQANEGRFDTLISPPLDPVTGKIREISEGEYKQALSNAAEAARRQGKMPGEEERWVKSILDPQIGWKEHIRMLVTGRLGQRGETWDRPNRRRLVLNPILYTPGRKGFGADTVVFVQDNSGSITEKEYDVGWTEIGAVLQDVKPRKIVVIWCDAAVRRVEEVTHLGELAHIRMTKTPGGGGTDFRPAFKYVEDHNIKPDVLIYFTDMYGEFPKTKPNYDVIWCTTTDRKHSWGDHVRVVV